MINNFFSEPIPEILLPKKDPNKAPKGPPNENPIIPPRRVPQIDMFYLSKLKIKYCLLI